jgi:DMSO reductase anchor subunit
MMWRTSWMSREVLLLPAFIGIVALWWLALRVDLGAGWQRLLPLAAILGALALWYCTAMIYACMRFIQDGRIR